MNSAAEVYFCLPEITSRLGSPATLWDLWGTLRPSTLLCSGVVMRIASMMMGLKDTSLEIGFVKRKLMHKILKACMFRVDQSLERRQDKSNKLWGA
ncbi:hypothetical protein CDL15_Pgr009221 [Punica granatum]|uniref:Uncharacterized protein n=1 Tax=Punica granatum TaxID=22663 RepID=A0A218WVN0_PUNGR|nr:hypothetical protein CDL15_Pgr009221 [Punica granatum]